MVCCSEGIYGEAMKAKRNGLLHLDKPAVSPPRVEGAGGYADPMTLLAPGGAFFSSVLSKI